MHWRDKQTLRNIFIIGVLIFIGWRLGGYDGMAASDYSGIPTVIDGDSIELEHMQIRLYGIDAPELDQECQKGKEFYACGRDSRRHLAKLIGGAIVECHEEEIDQFDRAVAECFVGEKNLSEEMVRAGWAISFMRFASPYLAEEADAQAAKRGLWQGDFQEPAEHRADNRLEFDW